MFINFCFQRSLKSATDCCQTERQIQQAVGGRRPVMPRPSPPPWAPKRLPPPSRRQRSSSFPRPTRSHAHRCSRQTRQHGGEQSGLVTLTFDILILTVVSESRVTWATAVPILVFLGLSVLDLGPMSEADLWFLVPWARFPDCAPLSDGPSDDGFQLTLSVSKFTYLINE